MMNANIVMLAIILVCVLLIVGIYFAAVLLSKKKVNPVPAMDGIEKGLGYAESIAEALKPFLPGIAGKTIDLVIDFAQKAVSQVEATYKSALLTDTNANDQRKATATSLIESALTLEGIKPDDKTEKLISAIIDTLVLALPKTHAESTPQKAQATAEV